MNPIFEDYQLYSIFRDFFSYFLNLKWLKLAHLLVMDDSGSTIENRLRDVPPNTKNSSML